jgi:hypothetical protein
MFSPTPRIEDEWRSAKPKNGTIRTVFVAWTARGILFQNGNLVRESDAHLARAWFCMSDRHCSHLTMLISEIDPKAIFNRLKSRPSNV